MVGEISEKKVRYREVEIEERPKPVEPAWKPVAASNPYSQPRSEYRFIDSSWAYGRVFGALIGLASVFLAWMTATATASTTINFGYGTTASTATASSSLITIMGNGGSAGMALGGGLFILGALLAIFSYYGWIAQGLGLLAFGLSVPARMSMNIAGYANVSVTCGLGIGVGVAALSIVIGLVCIGYKGLEPQGA